MTELVKHPAIGVISVCRKKITQPICAGLYVVMMRMALIMRVAFIGRQLREVDHMLVKLNAVHKTVHQAQQGRDQQGQGQKPRTHQPRHTPLIHALTSPAPHH